MTVRDVINDKDYDYIEWRVTPPPDIDEESIFFGACKSENGKLIPLDFDTYDENEEVFTYEQWCTDKIKRGLTIITVGEWL